MNNLMTLDRAQEELEFVVRKGYQFIKGLGFEDCLEIYGLVDADETDPNTRYRLKALNRIMNDIYEDFQSMSYLRLRESAPIGKVITVPGKRFGYRDGYGRTIEFSCGYPLEVFLPDSEGVMHWFPTHIEHDGDKYYLVDHHNTDLKGLLIRDMRM